MRATVIHQHTNNFGDDVAGAALVRGLRGMAGADEVDVFYIWHRNGAGLPAESREVRHHMPKLLAGVRDRRPELAVRAALAFVHPELARGELRELLDTCRRSDVTFVAPAGSNIGIYKDWMYLLTLVVLTRGGVRPVFCQNTIGPSSSRPFDRLARYVLERSTVYVRERRSHAYLQGLGIDAHLGVDTALMLEPVEPSTDAEPYVTVVPTRLSSWHRDHRGLADAAFLGEALPSGVADVARDAGVAVHVLAHLYGPEAEGEMLQRLCDALQDRGCAAVVVSPTTFEEYQADLAGARAVVSMRYHGLVMSGHAGTPCVSLAYENKMLEAAAYLDMTDLVLDVTSATARQISTLLSQAMRIDPGRRSRLRDLVSALQQKASAPVTDNMRRLAPARGQAGQ